MSIFLLQDCKFAQNRSAGQMQTGEYGISILFVENEQTCQIAEPHHNLSNNRSAEKITLQKYLRNIRPLFPTLSASVTNQKVLERLDDLNIGTHN